jgi:hypothetical protein
MYSARSTRALPRVGFPIRRSRDQRLVSTSPALIAAAHVLHRLLAPRHPPCALVLLIEKNTLCVAMEFSRCSGPEAPKCYARARLKPRHGMKLKNRPAGRSLKTQQHALIDPVPGFSLAPAIYYLEVDVILGDLVVRTSSLTWNDSINEPGATGVIAPESLERR